MKRYNLKMCEKCGELYDVTIPEDAHFHTYCDKYGYPQPMKLPPSEYACYSCGESCASHFDIIKRSDPQQTETYCATCGAITPVILKARLINFGRTTNT
jgi:uncharacterized Zn finger protein